MPKICTEFAAVGPPPLPPPRLALSILEFCKAHGISEGFFYKLKKHGEGPREMKVGARTLITLEAAADWRRARENHHRQDRRRIGDRSASDTAQSAERIGDGVPPC